MTGVGSGVVSPDVMTDMLPSLMPKRGDHPQAYRVRPGGGWSPSTQFPVCCGNRKYAAQVHGQRERPCKNLISALVSARNRFWPFRPFCLMGDASDLPKTRVVARGAASTVASTLT